MRGTFLWSSLLFLGFCPTLAFCQDASKLERKIAKEPRYESKAPWYCLLLFGAKAKAKVWMVLDGEKLYVDHNGTGDLTEPGKWFTRARDDDFFRIPDLKLGVGKSRYSDLRVNWRQDGIAAKEKLDMHVIVRVNDYDQYAIVSASAENPAKATLLHFDGPLKVQLFRSPGHFTRGAECKLGVSIVTKYPGVECVQISHEKGIPADVHPVVEIAVPAEAPDAKPRTIKAKLESRCWGALFHGPVRVPEDIGVGKAKMTISFPDWKGAKVTAMTVEVPVKDPEPAKGK